MTREEAYSVGWHEGRLRAEVDLANNLGEQHDQAAYLRVQCGRDLHGEHNRAWFIGATRGYRDTVARHEHGELTWEMFDI